jgi:LmbE family N-acetylglucosaminyl deacetylase
MRAHAWVLLGAALAAAGGAAVTPGLAGPAAVAEERPRTLLAVFAHPDDEQVVSPMLARYAREGVRVRLAIATDGRKGVREHAGIPAGEALAAARAAEARCACEKLGIQPPILMGLEDGALQVEANRRALLERVAGLLEELEPDAIVTWGPDGVTGHTDHRMVSNIVTEVVQRGGAGASGPLFYAGLSAAGLPALRELGSAPGGGVPQDLTVVDDRFLPVRVAYRDEDARRATESLACHKTQYTPEEAATMSRMARLMENGAVRLRPWFGDPAPATDLFR